MIGLGIGISLLLRIKFFSNLMKKRTMEDLFGLCLSLDNLPGFNYINGRGYRLANVLVIDYRVKLSIVVCFVVDV